MDVRRDVVRIRVLVRQRKDGEITEWEGCVCTDCVQQPAATETGKKCWRGEASGSATLR